jgi:hypothetical protein
VRANWWGSPGLLVGHAGNRTVTCGVPVNSGRRGRWWSLPHASRLPDLGQLAGRQDASQAVRVCRAPAFRSPGGPAVEQNLEVVRLRRAETSRASPAELVGVGSTETRFGEVVRGERGRSGPARPKVGREYAIGAAESSRGTVDLAWSPGVSGLHMADFSSTGEPDGCRAGGPGRLSVRPSERGEASVEHCFRPPSRSDMHAR